MGSRYEIELKLVSARGLKNVNWRYGPNRPYAVVWVDPSNKTTTRVDEEGDTDPNWDETLVIPLPPEPVENLTLHVDVVHAGREEDTKPLIGSARLKLAEVLDDVGFGVPLSKTLKLKRPSGRPQGKVEVKVTIREPRYRAPDPYNAPPYGVPPPGSRDYSPAPGSGYGYAYGGAPPVQGSYYSNPPAGYPYGGGYGGAPPQPAAYGGGGYGGYGGYGSGAPSAAPVVVEEKKKSKFGGMGTGLAVGALAGAVGGIALVEGAEYLEDKIADDAAEKVEDDLGYDDGGYDGDDF
ncbi:hypothetical protein PIB30_039264 [Stylosanthes scabra]|uniref:C2 domain-containing protein n=1 Tax=Stylosanthes scabra TaxID=79078 RepID=A0ABU6VH42_9FABA|nr:hypothetical protein [Stylosanthes scabra]